jgi:FtsZ-binding cell division protein ZapB
MEKQNTSETGVQIRTDLLVDGQVEDFFKGDRVALVNNTSYTGTVLSSLESEDENLLNEINEWQDKDIRSVIVKWDAVNRPRVIPNSVLMRYE